MNESNQMTMTKTEERKIMQHHLFQRTRLMTLDVDCWHTMLKNECGCPASIENLVTASS